VHRFDAGAQVSLAGLLEVQESSKHLYTVSQILPWALYFGPFSGFCPLFVHSLSTLPIRFLFLIQIPDSSPQHHPAGSAFKQAPVYRFPNPHIPSKNHFSQHRIFSSWSVRFWSFFGLCPLFLHSFSTLPIRFLTSRSRLLIPNSVHFLCDLRDL
jgi:hypothetical protein